MQVDSCCVAYNNFQFKDLYEMVSSRNHSQWIETGRLHMGISTVDKRLQAMLAVQEATSRNIDSISMEVKQVSETTSRNIDSISREVKNLAKEVKQVNETTKNLANWGQNQRKCYEQVVCGVLERYLLKAGFTDIVVEDVEAYRKTSFFIGDDGVGVDAVQWDGVVMCTSGTSEMLFLLEAKMTQHTDGMISMPGRVERTLRFIAACHNGQMPAPGAMQRSKDLCLMWGRCYGRVTRGVLAVDVIPPSAMNMAESNGYITIRTGDGAFDVQDCATVDN